MKSKTTLPAILCFSLLTLSACSHAPEKSSPVPTEAADKVTKEKIVTRTEQTAVNTSGNVAVAPPPAPATQKLAAETALSAPPIATGKMDMRMKGGMVQANMSDAMILPPVSLEQESYNPVGENAFVLAARNPLSTFSIDVDTASYANVRRFLQSNTLPPPGAVRAEEMINYFHYDYPEPTNGDIGIHTELGPCPWRKGASLVKIGIKAKDLGNALLPPSNMVFLIDVSGSMNQENKLPLLQQSMHMLTDQLTASDRLGIVVYAGNDCVVLPPTSGDQKTQIHAAISNLAAGGSTNASSGIATAYRLARQSFMPGGNNRIILASDGDFNVGITSRDELEKLIEKERQSGVYLTVLGFGMGNYHDDTMEILADKGNGNYGYIDSLLEAKKVLIKERVSTLFTLAGDVKLQIEFNPTLVGAYRLIGYENRKLADEDFNNDRKDAGEIGIGHTVTALYEILPPDAKDLPSVDSLKYQKIAQTPGSSSELMTVKLRYKPKGSSQSTLISQPVPNKPLALTATSNDFRFSAAAAGFAMLLTNSENRGDLDYKMVETLASGSRGNDADGYRSEFLHLVETAAMLATYSQQHNPIPPVIPMSQPPLQ